MQVFQQRKINKLYNYRDIKNGTILKVRLQSKPNRVSVKTIDVEVIDDFDLDNFLGHKLGVILDNWNTRSRLGDLIVIFYSRHLGIWVESVLKDNLIKIT